MKKRNPSRFDLLASAVLAAGLTFGVACGGDDGGQSCGNAIVEVDEQCDDGNAAGGDGCSSSCQVEECGNATVDIGEQCDDGNLLSGDGCSAMCINENASPPVGARPDPATLDDWNLFANAATQEPYSDVIPYEVTSPLFTDYAAKHRFIYVPDGEQIEYDPSEKWVFPVGSVLVKTFAYPVDERDPGLGEQLVETRLLIHEGANGWRPIVYKWNEAQTEAVITPGGATVPVDYILADGSTRDIPNYQIPAHGACRECHGTVPDTAPIGPSTGMLNRDNDYGSGPENQVDHLHALGLFDQAPDAIGSRLAYPDPFTSDITVSETDKGRSYLQSNCSHCHSPTGLDSLKELYLDWDSTDPMGATEPYHWGVCKLPTSAGGVVGCDTQVLDVEPGDAESSLLACRVEITGPGLMPQLGRTLQHAEGLAVVEDWINAMNLAACDE